MIEKDPNDPSTTSHAYDMMVPRWELMRALLNGTEGLRQAGETFMPRHMEESDMGYDERLRTAVLLNLTELTLDTLVGKPFREPIKVGEDVPAEIVSMLEDVDLQGNNLDVFAFNWFQDGLTSGFSHVLVDFPRVEEKVDEEGNVIPRTRADDLAENLRPYWVHVPPENVIFAAAERINGVEKLTHVRIRELHIKQEGFAEVEVERIKVLEPGVVAIFEKKRVKGQKEQWHMVELYETSLDFIPMITFYADRDGLMLAKPPLYDLALMNVRWWQSNADQQSVLTVARFPIFAASGVEDDKGILRLGPRQIISTTDPSAKYYYVEHSGRAIEAGRQELHDLEDRMASYGAQLLRRKPGNSTATARAIDNAENVSQLQRMAVTFQDALKSALDMTAAWMDLESGGSVEINRNFSGLNDKNEAELEILFKSREFGDYSREAYLEELKRRNILDESFDAEADKKLIEQELIAFSEMTDPEDDTTEPEEESQDDQDQA